MKKIELLAVDVDGCITRGEGEPVDIGVLSRLQEINALSGTDPDIPAVTLCTGRQQPFVLFLAFHINLRTAKTLQSGPGRNKTAHDNILF